MAIFSKSIQLSDENKEFIQNTLKPFLKENDMVKVRRACDDTAKGGDTILSSFLEIRSFLLKTLGEKLYFKDSDEVIGCEFFTSSLKSCVLPDNIKTIGIGAFADSSLEKIILSPSLQDIGWYAFEKTKLREIIIPKSIKSVGMGAFEECPNLKTVKFEYNPNGYDIDERAFLNTDCVIYIPKEFELEEFNNTDLENKIQYY